MSYIDLTYLKSISGNDEEFIRDMLRMFLKETLDDVLEIEKYVISNACGQIAALAHKVKGPLQMLSQQSADMVIEIETMAKQNAGGPRIAPYYAKLKKLVSEDMVADAKALLAAKE